MLTRPTCSECERPLPDEPGNRPGPARQTCSVRCRQIRARRKREERAAREATKIAFRQRPTDSLRQELLMRRRQLNFRRGGPDVQTR